MWLCMGYVKINVCNLKAEVEKDIPLYKFFLGGKTFLSFIFQAKNPAFVFIILGGTVEIFIIGGLATFGAKLFQEFFNVDIYEAGNLMGIYSLIMFDKGFSS